MTDYVPREQYDALARSIECRGDHECPAFMHIHGCYTAHRADQCDAPDEHGHLPPLSPAAYDGPLEQMRRLAQAGVRLSRRHREERDEARAERDALASKLTEVRALRDNVFPGATRRRLDVILDTAPAVYLALHDAEVFDQGANAVADHMWDGDGGGIVNPYRAAAIREEAK